jgi:hypothetical protein
MHRLRNRTEFVDVRGFIATIRMPMCKTLICGRKNFSFLHHVQIVSAAHRAPCLVGTAGSSGVRRPQRGATHLHACRRTESALLLE